MTENQFIMELEQALKRLPTEERNDILQDIREYFSNGKADGKTETEIASSLGTPDKIAAELLDAYPFSETNTNVAKDPSSEVITIQDDSFSKVDIEVFHGTLTVIPSNNNETKIELLNPNDKLELTADVVGDTLKVRLKKKGLWLFVFNFNTKAVALNVFIPKKLYQSISMKSDNGRINAEKLIGKTIDARTDNGRIELAELAATVLIAETDNGRIEISKVQSDRLKAKTDNGRITLAHVEADLIHAKSDNGRIEFEHVDGNLVGVTDNGRITLVTEHLDRNINFETDNGSIEVKSVRKPTNALISAKTGHGRIDVYGDRNSRTRFGAEEYQIQLKSDNGRITVK
ncbi:DUF4097 family beta strand repeat-containing protein [Sporosarcina thermotolerans]|uniref:DUF4097 family beta strand repeat-containing protein n=1 Tax=Sporosarcina thermotolerans TaxID=633404 RepID=A0AAW9A599_9BACL|nr:DUF4097 family beta strand repeat-containing protein [Sporosarcina thermotolerans]MDW0116015.1 DUF4097 family beta strand repeat-containing protein [Sporosarcina thermotolerans]